MWDFLRKCFDYLGKAISTGFAFINTGWIWAVAALTAYVLTPAKTFWAWVGQLFDNIVSSYPAIKNLLESLHVNQLGDYWANSYLSQAVAVASNWFPFDFALACLTGLVILWIFCLVFKLLRKSIFFFVGG